MALSLKVDLDNYPQGEEVAIEGVGRFVNGGDAQELSTAAEEAFFTINNRPISEISEQEGFTLSGSSEFTPPVGEVDEEKKVVEIPANDTDTLSNVLGQPTGLPQDGDN